MRSPSTGAGRAAARRCPPRWRRLAALTGAGAGLALIATFAMPVQASAGSARPAERAAAPVTDPAALVNPFIGTSNDANDFPGADMPFGMVQWSPDTPSRPPGGGYEYKDSSITGFSLTHIAGPGCGAAGDIPVLPTVGAVDYAAKDSFSHSAESATAGAYKVALDNKVTTELTATTRSGMARFTFPSTTQANLLFKLGGSQNGGSNTRFTAVSATEVSGQVTSGRFCGAGNTYTVYFDMVFDRPYTAQSTSGANARVTFDTTGGQVVRAKVGLSYVSVAGAVANRTAEAPGWDFDATRAAAHRAWNDALGKIGISGGTTDRQTLFYTALYHSLLHPNVISDTTGQYYGFDGRTHTVDPGHDAAYANYSGWDIYRSQAQLEALVSPEVASDTAQSMLDDYRQTGVFPKWSENNGESYVMVGDPAAAILADYHAFGARDFDTSAALAGLVKQASTANNDRPGLNYLDAPGYLPHNGGYGCCNFYGPVATTLEYATADFALSAFAGALGDTANQRTYADRAQDWRGTLDPASGFVQPRNADGTWTAGFDPTGGTDMVEADSWIYSGMVPFDVAGLAAAKGGDAVMSDYLDTVLRSYTGANGYAWVGNEPSIELPWEYDYLGEPYKTQGTVRAIQDQIWANTPAGLADGNDDLGAMSAWYVWSALGMFPMTPGTDDLALGSPLFPQAVLTLPSGRTLTINGEGAADDAPYVQSASFDGAAWNNAYAPTNALSDGGTLTYRLGTTANTSWASAASAAPPSYHGSDLAPPDPRAGIVTSGVNAGTCLDVDHSGTADGTAVQIHTCNSTYAQDWTVAGDGTLRALGKCLDVANSGTANGTTVRLWTCNGTGAQTWSPGSGGTLVNTNSGRCLNDPNASTADGTRLEIRDCAGGTAQKWNLPAAPRARTGPVTAGAGQNLCLDDRSGATADGTPIQIRGCDGGEAQTVTVAADSTLRLRGGCVDAADSGTTEGTRVQLYTCNGTNAQQWRATSAGRLVNTNSGLCLAAPSTTEGTQLQLRVCDGGAAQRWTLPA
ncbi:lectin [Streptomyces griseoaurantiacus]|uniref:lectin n=1 Tax=Streptomyces griseoaurantiacus TaxID=68213 RepID=UPI00345F9E06